MPAARDLFFHVNFKPVLFCDQFRLTPSASYIGARPLRICAERAREAGGSIKPGVSEVNPRNQEKKVQEPASRATASGRASSVAHFADSRFV